MNPTSLSTACDYISAPPALKCFGIGESAPGRVISGELPGVRARGFDASLAPPIGRAGETHADVFAKDAEAEGDVAPVAPAAVGKAHHHAKPRHSGDNSTCAAVIALLLISFIVIYVLSARKVVVRLG
jgi:hypothetical protein